jgi:AcrR family transcriptional regulator
MRLSFEKRRQQIILRAIRLFARRGFKATTSKQIARAAGVSEAMVFKIFSTKKRLYTAIIDYKLREIREAVSAIRFPSAVDPRKVLTKIARAILERIEADEAFLRLLFFSALEGYGLSQLFFEREGAGFSRPLRQYIYGLQKRGRFRRLDTGLVVQFLIGIIIHYTMLKHVFKVSDIARVSRKKVIHTFITLFTEGLKCR